MLPLLLLSLFAADDAKSLAGDWKLVASTFDGNEAAAKDLADRRLTFGDKSFTAFAAGKKGNEVAFTLDPTKEPKRIDLMLKGKETALGVYELRGDKLTLCYGESGKERPTTFASEKGERRYLIVLERVKK